MTENSEMEQTGGAPEDLTPETKPSNNPDGRPTLYKDEYVEQAKKLCLLGATDKDLGDFFEVSEVTINAWKNKHPEFLKSIKGAKEEADSKVVRSLYERATGYSHPEEKIFCNDGEITRADTTKHYPPDPTSMIFWLKNRDKDKWRDKHDHELSGELNIKKIENVIIDPDNPSS